MHYFAAICSFNTLDYIANLSLSEQLNLYENATKHAHANVSLAATNMGILDYRCFFAVPEYYFTKGLPKGGPLGLYSESERDQILMRLLTLSDQYPRLIMIPGTVNWRRGPIAPVTHRTRTTTYEGFSSVPIFAHSDHIHTYDKVMNDGHVDRTTDTRFVPGTASSLFQVDPLQCGIEVCGDFNEGNLAKTAAPQSLDIEIMISATNYHQFHNLAMPQVPVKDGGYFIHVDQNGRKTHNGVWAVNRGKGMHGRDVNVGSGLVYDPWTLETLYPDQAGITQSVNRVIQLQSVRFNANTSGMKLPGQRPFAGLTLRIDEVLPARPLSGDGTYQVMLRTALDRTIAEAPTDSPIDDREIHFHTNHGRVNHSTVRTDGTGQATVRFTLNKNHVSTLRASFHGAVVVVRASIDAVGAGNVTHITPLKGMPHPDVQVWSIPLP